MQSEEHRRCAHLKADEKAQPGDELEPCIEQDEHDAVAAAQELFSVLRGFDDKGVQLIWIEAPPATPEWDGVRDRLQRAAAGFMPERQLRNCSPPQA